MPSHFVSFAPFSDLNVECEGKNFHLHRSLVLSKSNVLKEKYEKACRSHGCHHPTIVVPNAKKNVFESVVNWVYEDEYTYQKSEGDDGFAPLRHHAQVVAFAANYDIEELYNYAGKKLVAGLPPKSHYERKIPDTTSLFLSPHARAKFEELKGMWEDVFGAIRSIYKQPKSMTKTLRSHVAAYIAKILPVLNSINTSKLSNAASFDKCSKDVPDFAADVLKACADSRPQLCSKCGRLHGNILTVDSCSAC